MIIYGIGKKRLSSSEIDDACPNCGHNELSVAFYQKYFYLFFIPVFPTSKIPFVECKFCKKAYDDTDIPEILDVPVERKRQLTKTPLYLWIGTVLFTGVLIAGFINEQNEKGDTKKFLEEPRVGDYFIIHEELEGTNYMIEKVSRVSDDSVFTAVGTFGYLTPFGADKAINEGKVDNANYFIEVERPYIIPELQRMNATERLIKVVRK